MSRASNQWRGAPLSGPPDVPGTKDDLFTPVEIGRFILIGVRDLSIPDIRFTGSRHLTRTNLKVIIAFTGNFAANVSTSITITITTKMLGRENRVTGLVGVVTDTTENFRTLSTGTTSR
jgi:hypothetical protein